MLTYCQTTSRSALAVRGLSTNATRPGFSDISSARCERRTSLRIRSSPRRSLRSARANSCDLRFGRRHWAVLSPDGGTSIYRAVAAPVCAEYQRPSVLGQPAFRILNRRTAAGECTLRRTARNAERLDRGWTAHPRRHRSTPWNQEPPGTNRMHPLGFDRTGPRRAVGFITGDRGAGCETDHRAITIRLWHSC